MYYFLQTLGFITEEIMRMEVEDSLERLNVVLNVCQSYQDCFFHHRDILQSYKVADASAVPDWNFDTILVFARLQRFLQHIKALRVTLLDK